MTLPSRVPPIVTFWTWARPWPSAIIDSLRVSVQRTGRSSRLLSSPSTISSGYVPILAPKPPPTSGVMTRTWSASSSLPATKTPLMPWACCVDTHWCRRPSTHAAADAAHLQRARRDALVDEAARRRDLAVGEELVARQVRRAEGGRVEHDVAAGGLVEVGRRRQRLLGVDDRVEHVVVDDDGLGGVGRLAAGLGDDGGDRLADVAHPVAGQQRARHRRVERRRRRLEAEVGGREHAEHARHRRRPRTCRST